MPRAVYEYTKEVLQKVSFNSELFYKELKKALKQLLPYEIQELKIWLTEFTHDLPELHYCLVIVD
jgi:DNA replication protein DnaD